jgi:selenocysteine lyase/cysteine desulfurase
MSAPLSMRDDIRKFEEIGTNPIALRGAITEALTFHDTLGPERKAARLRYLKNRWTERVRSVPGVRILHSERPEESCGIGAMSVDGVDANDLTRHLEETYRIHVRPRVVAGEFSCIRVTPNVFTTLEEIDFFSEAIERIATKGID